MKKDNIYTLLPLGFKNVAVKERIVAIVSADPAPIKRMVNEARKANRLIDATNGRRTRAVVITDSNHLILSASLVETLAQKMCFSPEVKSQRDAEGFNHKEKI